MERKVVKCCFRYIDEIIKAVDAVPHGLAMPIIHQLDELREVIGEELPGGYFSQCEGCGEPIGNDDSFYTSDDCYLCEDCGKGGGESVEEILVAEAFVGVQDGS